MMSLTIRLFANMFAGDMVTLVFFSLVPLGIPVIFLGLHIGVSILQAYIFALLTTVYSPAQWRKSTKAVVSRWFRLG